MKKLQGLTTAEAEKSANDHGRNLLTPKKRKTFLQTYMSNFDDPIITVLLIALGINVIFTFFGKVDWHECCGILLSVIISTFVSAVSEYSNESTFEKLRDEASKTKCKVWRDGELKELLTADVVCGDLILLQPGDVIPADGRITEGRIFVDQSSLNGETKECEKVFDGVLRERAAFSDFWGRHCLFRGSTVCSGEAKFVADNVGDNTVYGKLTSEAQEDGRESPLTHKLSMLAKSISKFGCISAVAIVLISFFNNVFINNCFDPVMIAGYFSDKAQVVSDIVSSLIVGIIVIVVAVPEGLPLMIAIVCSLNMKKMLKANVLVRRISGIEASGVINILFTDKTGTITYGKPKVIGVYDGSGEEYKEFSKMPDGIGKLYGLSVTLNSAARYSNEKIIGGNTTEKALLEFMGKCKSTEAKAKILKKAPFSSDKKYSAACVSGEKKLTLVKGAPEIMLPLCNKAYAKNGEKTMFKADVIENKIKSAANDAKRIIVLAAVDGEYVEELPKDMVFIGAAIIRDDVRAEAKTAVSDVRAAGIRVVMVTGDRSETASAVAREAGILTDDGVVITSKELANMSDAEVERIIPRLCVVARALPADKSRLVKIAQRMNLIVGMTGDGVNDAPALKLADVGYAMGGGTDAAAAAADIVLLDDNFRSIRNAVLYGRTIYKSIKKFIQFQLTINVAAVGVSMLGPIVGVERPLDISQMIWTNLMIDSLAAIAFGGEPALSAFMREKPQNRDDAIIDKNMWGAIAFNGLYICGLSLIFFVSPYIRGIFRESPNDICFYTAYFTLFIFISIANAFNARCDGIDLLHNLALNKNFLTVMGGIVAAQIFMTYYGGKLLRTVGLNMYEWSVVVLLALTIIPADIIRKLISRKVNRS